MNDRDLDIFMVEMEARNQALIEEFMVSKMRPRDLQAMVDQLNAQEFQQQQQLAPPQEPGI